MIRELYNDLVRRDTLFKHSETPPTQIKQRHFSLTLNFQAIIFNKCFPFRNNGYE